MTSSERRAASGKWLAFFVALILGVAACQPNDGSWSRIEEAGVLRVGVDPTFPPFALEDGDALQGIDVELAEALAAEMGLEVQFVWLGYDGLYDALKTNQVDAVISALVIDHGKMRDFSYSDPYFNAGEVLIVRADEDDIEKMKDADGRILAVELGAQGHVEALKQQKQLQNLTIEPYNTPEEALTAVLDHRADAALVDQVGGRLFLSAHPALKRLSPPVTVEPYAIVTRIEDERLLKEINGRLQILKENGTLNKILARWLDNESNPSTHHKTHRAPLITLTLYSIIIA